MTKAPSLQTKKLGLHSQYLRVNRVDLAALDRGVVGKKLMG
jgi:hypothetical protein